MLPPKRTRPTPYRVRRTCLLLLALSLAWPAAISATTETKSRAGKAVATPEIAEKQADLGELRSRIDALRKSLNTNEESKADAADRLRDAERRISQLQRELHELADQRNTLQKKLQQLEQQSAELGATLSQQQQQLEKLLYRQYLRGTPDSLQLLLNGNDPNQMTRDLHYIAAIATSRADLMAELRSTLARKQDLAADTKSRGEELAALEAEQQKRHAELEKQRNERQKLFAQLADKVKSQRKEIGTLQQDERRLSQLIDRLSRIIATQAAQAAQAARTRAADAARQAEAARSKPSSPSASEAREKPLTPQATTEPARPKTSEAENRYEPVSSDGSFLRQRGNLRLPVRGSVSGRFGAPRDGGGTWRGLFIRAAAGNDVKAVANGRIVFSDWMRGFGNLVIVDHGDAYLSIYGNNESVLKQVGQAVRGGETIATVGNSGGNPDSGLYFELRHQGQPIDPMKWASLK